MGAAIGGSLPDWTCFDELVEALAAAFACRLQLLTLEVEIFRSVAISLACLPLLTSFITASQSTQSSANAGGTLVANVTVVTSIAEAAASTIFFVSIFFRAEVRVPSND